jgi:tetratricopeptide (TPR) repeat protein
MPRRWWIRIVSAGVLATLALALRPSVTIAADAVLDAKRRAASQLVHDGKLAEALSIMEEVTKIDDTAFADHLLMARAHDKQGQTAEALRQYRRVIELTSPSARDSEERSARQEADKKLKALDPLGSKIDETTEEFYRKLDSLEREAVGARSMLALERVFRMRGMLWQAQKRRDHAFCEVFASGAWQDSGLDVRAGQTYRVRAAGTWRVKGKGEALVECTAAGMNERPPNYIGREGQLEAMVGTKAYILGEDALITPETSGRLQLIENDDGQPFRLKNAGSLQVLIQPRN